MRIAVVGAGPRAVMLLERLSANLQASDSAVALSVTLIDPHRPGPGRIWRSDQSPLLKLNSMAKDVTVFTDDSCRISGPVVAGPSLLEWAREVRSGLRPEVVIDDADVREEIARLDGESFPTRRLNSHYLGWFHDWIVRAAPAHLGIEVVQASVLSVEPGPGGDGHRLLLDTGAELDADIVVYAVGHNARAAGPRERELAAFAERNGLSYIGPDFTADADLSGLRPGSDVVVRGMGLAATDLLVLLFEGRGGAFRRGVDGRLRYVPSGAEPRVHLGSRRGVPYRSKITSVPQGDPPRLEVLTPEAIARLGLAAGDLDLERDVWPLVATEQLLGYYRELFTGHPDRVLGGWPEFARRVRELPSHSDELLDLIERAVPRPEDRFDLQSFDRPLGAESFASADALQERIRAHIRQDLDLRTSQEHSATQALFLTTLFAFMAVAEIPHGAWNARSRAVSLPRDWHASFSYLASGPPGHRLEELLALSEAGVVRFLGPDVRVRAEDGVGFVADSPRLPDAVTATALVDAWLPESRASESLNPVLRQLVESGTAAELSVSDADFTGTTGRVRVRPEDARLLDADGHAHPTLFAVGNFTASMEAGAFTRPNSNALPFRQNDAIARAVIDEASRAPRRLASMAAG
ncbi:MAG: FAD/NAD(P)-binding protein [Leifsonia sp.]